MLLKQLSKSNWHFKLITSFAIDFFFFDQFHCKSNECVAWSYVCDGIAHCSNKADEDCDMCTNDLYLCKDSSRINCTLACSTLGYIPCKNYMDKKICATVMKQTSNKYLNIKSNFKANNRNDDLIYQQQQQQSHLNDHLNNENNFLNSNTKNSFFLQDTFLFPGLFVFAFLLVVLVLFGVFYNRFKRAKRKHPIRQIEPTNARSTLSTSSSTSSYNYPNNNLLHGELNSATNTNNNNNNSISQKASKKNNKNNELKNDCLHQNNNYEILVNSGVNIEKNSLSEENGEILINDKLIRSETQTSTAQFELIDYQIYGEPPPSYKISKYFPRANISFDKNSTLSSSTTSTKLNSANNLVQPLLSHADAKKLDDRSSHIYENIDEINIYARNNEKIKQNSQEKRSTHQQQQQQQTQQRRGRFQALKRNSSINASLNNRSKLSKQQSESPTSDLSSNEAQINNKFKTPIYSNSTTTTTTTTTKTINGASSSTSRSHNQNSKENNNKQTSRTANANCINKQQQIIKSQSEQFL